MRRGQVSDAAGICSVCMRASGECGPITELPLTTKRVSTAASITTLAKGAFDAAMILIRKENALCVRCTIVNPNDDYCAINAIE